MKVVHTLTGFLLLVGSASVSAAVMVCGTHEIRDGQIPGQTRAEIEKKCGTPESIDGNNFYYRKGSVTYRLHFNDSDELESIEEEQE